MQAKSVSDTVRIRSFYSFSPSSLLPVKDRMKHREDLSVHHHLAASFFCSSPLLSLTIVQYLSNLLNYSFTTREKNKELTKNCINCDP